tara:strand:- start:186 stop:533 length:348 start_codon:yes stop_codon:yes gene_type:complete
MITFYNDELATMTNGAITQDSLDFNPKEHKTAESAAKALHKALCERAEAEGQKPELEVHIWTPEEEKKRNGHACWRVSWEAGPYEWAIGASFEITGPWGYTEPYYSFDLCFEEDA